MAVPNTIIAIIRPIYYIVREIEIRVKITRTTLQKGHPKVALASRNVIRAAKSEHNTTTL